MGMGAVRARAASSTRTADGVKDVSSKAVDTVKQHPISAAMIGGAWWASPWWQSWPLPQGRAVRVAGAAGSGPKRTTRVASPIGRELYGSLKEGALHLGESIEEGYVYSKDTIGILWENHPLAIGTGILALGVAAGMLLPASRIEGGLLGGAGQFTDKLATAGKNWLDQGAEFAGRVASETGNAIRGEAERAGLTPEKLSRTSSG